MTTFMRSTLDTRYLGDRFRRGIRVQRFQKPTSNEIRLIMLEIPKNSRGRRSYGPPWTPGTSETVAGTIIVFNDPKNPRVTSFD